MFQTSFVEKVETHILCSIMFCENLDVYEKMWIKNVVRCRPQMTIWRMHIECWIPKAKNTQSLCNTHCFANATIFARTRFKFTLYVNCLYCLNIQFTRNA
jgi:hypothetical protein